jgi:hypothetical protein
MKKSENDRRFQKIQSNFSKNVKTLSLMKWVFVTRATGLVTSGLACNRWSHPKVSIEFWEENGQNELPWRPRKDADGREAHPWRTEVVFVGHTLCCTCLQGTWFITVITSRSVEGFGQLRSSFVLLVAAQSCVPCSHQVHVLLREDHPHRTQRSGNNRKNISQLSTFRPFFPPTRLWLLTENSSFPIHSISGLNISIDSPLHALSNPYSH